MYLPLVSYDNHQGLMDLILLKIHQIVKNIQSPEQQYFDQ